MIVQYLMRSEILDEATCEVCEALNGITLPADDPAWAGELGQEAHCNCRYMLVPLYTELPTGLETTPLEEIENIKRIFGALTTTQILDRLRITARGTDRIRASEITFEDLADVLESPELLLKLFGEYYE